MRWPWSKKPPPPTPPRQSPSPMSNRDIVREFQEDMDSPLLQAGRGLLRTPEGRRMMMHHEHNAGTNTLDAVRQMIEDMPMGPAEPYDQERDSPTDKEKESVFFKPWPESKYCPHDRTLKTPDPAILQCLRCSALVPLPVPLVRARIVPWPNPNQRPMGTPRQDMFLTALAGQPSNRGPFPMPTDPPTKPRKRS